jgi:ElaB/YqjD/DUF883 family membrane-anchored ribosome-binding protein
MSEDPNAIREGIAETRERMSNTLGEIGERLNPQVLKENVKESIREATIGRMNTMARQAADTVGRATDDVSQGIRENPIPVAMVAVGLGWMIWNARAARQHATYPAYRPGSLGYGNSYGTDASYGAGYESGYSAYGSTVGNEGGSFADRVGDEASQVTARARDKAHELGDEASRKARLLADRARDAADTVRHRAQDAAHSVAESTRRGAETVEQTYDRNPLAMGALALAVGLAAGLAAPVTDREVRWMGDARDELVDRVKDAADEAREKVERVASHVADEAKVAAQDEGLISPA